MTVGIVFTLPLGRWLNKVPVLARQIRLACVVVLGIILYTAFGHPATGNPDAPGSEWAIAIVVIAIISVGLVLLGRSGSLSVRAGTYGSASGIVNGLAATLTKPAAESFHSGGLAALASNWQFYTVCIAGLLGIVFLQVALQTARLAPAIATGSVTNPLTAVLLGILLLDETLQPPTWHKAVAWVALGLALFAAITISLSREEAKVDTGPEPSPQPAPS
jgi:hypothetical protein